MEFEAGTERSRGWAERALRTGVGPSQSTPKGFDPYPFFTRSAQGSRVVDVDGNTYVDFVLGLGPLIVGHNHPQVVAAIQAQIARGIFHSTPTEVEVELAEKLVQHVPCAESVRLTTSGTEANMLAIRIARAYTGRDVVLRPTGDYMGWHDALAPGLYVPAHQPHGGAPLIAGVPRGTAASTLEFEYNDLADFNAAVARAGAQRVAAVFMEAAFRSTIPPAPGFLAEIRRTCDHIGAVLILDEVVSGFRFGLGGAQRHFGVWPDLATFGKALGGGLPIGAVTGRRELMQVLAAQTPPDRRVDHGGTWCGHPLAAAAGLATLRLLEADGAYAELFRLGDEFQRRITQVIQRHRLPMQVFGMGPLRLVVFTDATITNFSSTRSAIPVTTIPDTKRRLVEQGILCGPDYLPAFRHYISLAHSTEDMEQAAAAYDIALAAASRGADLDTN